MPLSRRGLLLFLSQIFLQTNLAIALMSDLNLPLDSLAAAANAYAAAHGVQVEKKDKDQKSYFECAPMSLLPNAYPRSAFEEAQLLAPHFNVLVDRISRNPAFLQETLGGGVSDADPYTAKLLEIYQEIYLREKNQHALQADSLGIQRSDYMLNQGQIKQVELNTIASSFAGLSTRVAALHSFLLQRFEGMEEFLLQNKQAVLADSNVQLDATDGVPNNPALDRLPFAMNIATRRYEDRFSPSKTNSGAMYWYVNPILLGEVRHLLSQHWTIRISLIYSFKMKVEKSTSMKIYTKQLLIW